MASSDWNGRLGWSPIVSATPCAWSVSITSGTSAKARHLRDEGGRVAVCQVDGRRWLTLEGTAVVRDDAAAVADAVARYAVRYRQPRENPARVVLEISVDRILGNP